MSLEQRCRSGSFRAALTVTMGAHTLTQSSPAGTWGIALMNPAISEPNHVVVWLNGEGTQPYSSALVTSQCMDRLSIIARDRELHPATVGTLMDKAMMIGIDIRRLRVRMVPQSHC
ncbi:hypothetical protein BZG36_02108 [Bifiguratus adelaidae]|uniref:Uncharacterized protein n=1 Tax=Bifiguratus adelaidae TaxID=1938954 RepID=A0A261Y334_9FUNG|nr:hypothetical protein BZG36_02108 [Bifiguratus adelaidae]